MQWVSDLPYYAMNKGEVESMEIILPFVSELLSLILIGLDIDDGGGVMTTSFFRFPLH